jgi:hypothetical protein
MMAGMKGKHQVDGFIPRLFWRVSYPRWSPMPDYLAIVFHAAQGAAGVLGRTISVGSGVSGILPSLKYQVPVVIAWLALSSALLITLLPRVDFPEASALTSWQAWRSSL